MLDPAAAQDALLSSRSMASAASENATTSELSHTLTFDDAGLVSGQNAQSFPNLNDAATYPTRYSDARTLSFEDVRDWQSQRRFDVPRRRF